jgi:hypothetical protein
MKTPGIIIYFLFFIQSLQAQMNGEKMYCRNDSNFMISVYGGSSLASDHIPFHFSRVFLTGGHLHKDLKDEVLSHLSHRNNFGFENRYGATMMLKPVVPSDSIHTIRVLFGFEEQTIVFSTFGKDAYRLLMYGNEFTIGQKANLNDAKFRYEQFSKLFIGASRSFGKQAGHQLTILPFISFHKPPVSLNISEGFLLTEADTSLVTAEIEGKLVFGNDKVNPGRTVGGGIDIFYTNSTLLKSHCIILGVENLGVYQFQGTSYQFERKNVLNVAGLHLTDFNNLDSVFADYADSLVALGGNVKDSAIQALMMPVKLSLTLIQKDFGKLGIHGKCSFYPSYYRNPLFEILPFYRLNHSMILGIPVVFGGMGGIRSGLSADLKFKRIALNFLLSASAGRGKEIFFTGYGVYAGLTYKF